MMRRSLNRRQILLSGIAMAACMFLSGLTVDSGLRNLRDGDDEKKNSKVTVDDNVQFSIRPVNDKERPIMYTFYEPTDEYHGMSKEGDAKLLKAWAKAWHDRGWDTKILDGDDAKMHPDFDIIEDKLKSLKVGGYNRRCYWRWLAMAAIEGGGWMSDYDLFPLSLSAAKGQEIAEDPSFKSFALHVPCLLHASREEWDRVIHRMIDLLPNPEDTEGILDLTDMLSLREVGREEELKWSWDVAPQFPYSRNDNGVLEIDCEEGQRLAIHLSHYECSEAFQHDRYPMISDDIKTASEAVSRRGDAALYLMNDYNDQCVETV